jgi:serine/threonine-protein kinase HipA
MTASPADLKHIEAADVYKGEALAGTLTRLGDGGTAFAYSEQYLVGGGPPAASTLPLRPEPYVTGSGAVPAFFAGLLPEGVRLRAVIAAVKTSADDELSLLLAVAGDAVGDVIVVPAGEPPRPAGGAVNLTDPASALFRELFERSVDPSGAYLDRAVPGVQEKLSNAVVSFPLRRRATPSILKLNTPAYPRVVENEAFFLSLARACGFRVPSFEVIRDRDGHSGLLVERFDRTAREGTLARIAQEDACQFLGKWPADKYRVSVNDIAGRMVELASSPQAAVLDLIDQVAFAWVIGNGDLHAKNFSLQWRRDVRVVAPSPLYDIVSTLPYPVDQHLALRIDGRDDNLQGRFFQDFARRFGVPDALVRRRLGRIIARVSRGLPDIATIGFPADVTEKMTAEIERRLGFLARFAEA